MSPDELAAQLRSPDGSTRLRAALAAGSTPDVGFVDALVERSGVDADFFVRDMLTWALTRLPADRTVPRLVEELSSPFPQARSQSLHTLSKIADPRARPAVTEALLHDEEDEVAKAAWRLAVVLVVPGEEEALAADLARELGRRDREARRSLTRAFVALGDASRPALERVAASGTFSARVHAAASLLLLDEPQRDFASALSEARAATIAAGVPEEDAAG